MSENPCMQHLQVLQCLAGLSWGASSSTPTIGTSALAIVLGATDAHPEFGVVASTAKKLDIALNDTLHLTTGCFVCIPPRLGYC